MQAHQARGHLGHTSRIDGTAISVTFVGFGLYDMSQEMGADKFWVIAALA
jgi:purine-nucleoside phosphorylase